MYQGMFSAKLAPYAVPDLETDKKVDYYPINL